MADEDLIQFHSSPQSLAGELTFRNTFRNAGFSESEIDGHILRAYLRGRFYKTWGLLVLVGAIGSGVYWGLGATGFLILLSITFVAVWLSAIKYVVHFGEDPGQWIRRKGPTWTGIWERR